MILTIYLKYGVKKDWSMYYILVFNLNASILGMAKNVGQKVKGTFGQINSKRISSSIHIGNRLFMTSHFQVGTLCSKLNT